MIKFLRWASARPWEDLTLAFCLLALVVALWPGEPTAAPPAPPAREGVARLVGPSGPGPVLGRAVGEPWQEGKWSCWKTPSGGVQKCSGIVVIEEAASGSR